MAPSIPGEGTPLPTVSESWGTPGSWGSAGAISVNALSGSNGSGSTELVWIGLEEVLAMPDAAVTVLDAAVSAAMESLAAEMQDYAQENAPWQDRTGDARAGLHADVSEAGGHWVITLSYDVDYGVFLETHNGGEFAIVGPTVDLYSSRMLPMVMDAVAGAR